MFIEQIIELELRGPGPLGRTGNPKTTYFYDKTLKSKIGRENLLVNFASKYTAEGNAPCFPAPGPSQSQNLPKKS